MAFVRGVISRSRMASSRFKVSGRMSMKTGRAPRNTNAAAVETKVNDGTITSSPGWISSSSAAISSECVQEVVSSTLGAPKISSSSA